MQPCSSTTAGALAGRLSGRYAYMARLPGLEPKPVTWVSVAAWAGRATVSTVAAASTTPAAAPARRVRMDEDRRTATS